MSCMNIETRCRSPHSPCRCICYEENCCSKEKDMLISQLKAHIFELELREKDYNILKERYNQLQHDIAQLNDCKLQLECEKRLKDDNFNKSICQLEGENESLQLSFNDKLNTNKSIFSENNALGKEIELKDVEICELKIKLKDLNNQLLRNNEDRNNLTKMVNGLTEIKCSQSVKLSQLLEDNKTLKDICNEQDCLLKNSAQDRCLMGKELEEKNNDIQNLNCQIVKLCNDQNNLQNKLNKTNNINAQFQNTIKDYQIQSDDLKCQNENLNSNLIKEKSCRISENQKNNQLTCVLNDRDKKIDIQNHDIDSIKIMQQSASNRNCVLQDENAKLRNHILVLTDLNQTLINEIDNVIDEDAKMKCILDRKERIHSVLANNRCTIDQSLNNLDDYINRGKCFNCRNPSSPCSPCSPCKHIYECH